MGDANTKSGSRWVQALHLVLAAVLALAITILSQGGGPLVPLWDKPAQYEAGRPGGGVAFDDQIDGVILSPLVFPNHGCPR